MRSVLANGLIIISIASFMWGIGNYLTAYSSSKYHFDSTVMSVFDITLANFLGGLFVLIPLSIFLTIKKEKTFTSKSSIGNPLNYKLFLSGFFKGLNTFFFIISTVYIPASNAVAIENTYIIWALLFSLLSRNSKISKFTVLGTIFVFISILIIQEFSFAKLFDRGSFFAVLAGAAYFIFISRWSDYTTLNIEIKEACLKTMAMILISTISLLFGGFIFILVAQNRIWIPFRSLFDFDIYLQLLNGVIVIGVTYLLVTFGFSKISGKNTTLKNLIATVIMASSILVTFSLEAFYKTDFFSFSKIFGFMLLIFGLVLFKDNLFAKTK